MKHLMLPNFFHMHPQTNDITGTYDPFLVILSYLIAVFASYLALDIACNLHQTMKRGIKINTWMLAGAFTMGAGIWTMHFVGMLALQMPVEMHYDLPLTMLSLVTAILASGLALFLVIRYPLNVKILLAGGVMMGCAIAGMHYIGMAAMLDVHIRYIPSLFFLSIVIAILTSQVALALMVKSEEHFSASTNLISALIMGAAICGMHYVAMFAAVFTPTTTTPLSHTSLSSDMLSFYIIAMTSLIMGISLVLSHYTRNLIHSLQKANAELFSTKEQLHATNLSLSRFADTVTDREKRTRAVLDATADGIIVTHGNGTIEMCNRAAAEIFHYGHNELLGQHLLNILQFTDKSTTLANLLTKEKTQFELIGLRKDDRVFPCEISVSHLSVLEGPLYIIVIRDISILKFSQEEMKLFHEELLETAHQVGITEATSNMLSQIEKAIKEMTQSVKLLKETLNNPKLVELHHTVELLQTHAHHLSFFLTEDTYGKLLPAHIISVVKDWEMMRCQLIESSNEFLQNVSHIKDTPGLQPISKLTNRLELVSIAELIAEAITITKATVEAGCIHLECNLSSVAPILTNKFKLLQILISVIENAQESLSHNPLNNRSINIRAFMNKKNWLQIEVTDNGIGMSIENLPRVFNSGFTTKPGGKGFGMHAAALSAQELGGKLSVFSEGIGRGATFQLELPYKPSLSK